MNTRLKHHDLAIQMAIDELLLLADLGELTLSTEQGIVIHLAIREAEAP